MRRIAKSAAVTAGALLLGLATAAPSLADPTVAGQTAGATYDCGQFGVATMTLEASASGGTGSVSLTTSGGLAPVDIPANSITATLTLQRADGSTVDFSGTANAAAPAGAQVTIGPLTGAVNAGDSLDSYIPAAGSSDVSLATKILGTDNTCKATTKQDPGPFVF